MAKKQKEGGEELYSVSSLQKAMPWIFLLVGLVLVSIGIWYPFETDSKIKEMIKIVGGSVLSGGVFTYLVRYSQIMGIVKTELEEIIYESKHLRLRKDLDIIWEKVSLEVFRNKFNKINKSVLKDIKDQYLPTNHSAYYDEYKQWIDIELTDAESQTITVTNKCKFILVGSSKGKIKYELASIHY